MIALDTSVLARYLLQDNPAEQAEAEELIANNDCAISWSVLVELCWVMQSNAGMERSQVAEGLAAVAATQRIAVPDEALLDWAIDRYAKGADFADMIHLASAPSGSGEFACFDRKLARQAGSDAPLTIRTLRT